MVDEWNREALLAPIGEQGVGEDLSFSLVVDEIKEARRADPSYLSQGDWQSDLKRADWNAVIALSSQALAEQSKDLMLAGWLCEGLAHRDGFAGLAFGLELVAALCETYWGVLYPTLEEGEEERLGRFTWLDDTLASMVGSIALLDGQGGAHSSDHGYGLDRYEESRQVENLARNDPTVMDEALKEGKINAEIFQRSVVLSDPERLIERYRHIEACLHALSALDDVLVARLGDLAPSFSRLSTVLKDCLGLIERLLGDKGVRLDVVEDPAQDDSIPEDSPIPQASTPARTQRPSGALRTTPETREEAFAMLGAVAQYFKAAEPHSPVPYLVERAVRWGRMPLEDWLRDVIREDNVVDSIRETLGTQTRDEHSS